MPLQLVQLLSDCSFLIFVCLCVFQLSSWFRIPIVSVKVPSSVMLMKVLPYYWFVKVPGCTCCLFLRHKKQKWQRKGKDMSYESCVSVIHFSGTILSTFQVMGKTWLTPLLEFWENFGPQLILKKLVCIGPLMCHKVIFLMMHCAGTCFLVQVSWK